MLTPSNECFDIIKRFEGLGDGDPSTVNLDPYLCPADVATIGWGHAIYHEQKQLRGEEGLKKAIEIYPDGITKHDAEILLARDVAVKARGLKHIIDVPLNQNQYDALVSFCFNVGLGAFQNSTLLRDLNERRYTRAGHELKRWIYSKKVILPGLVNRRRSEMELFFKESETV